MLRLHSEALSPAWSEFVIALIKDLEPLGYITTIEADGALLIGEKAEDGEHRWDRAHAIRHQNLLGQHRAAILDFERDFAPLFVDMANFQPSAVRPALQEIDFSQPDHMRIVDYLRLYQSVTSGRAVGRRMGLFVWDVGQDVPKLFGAAVLASARFSQRIRDVRFGWIPDFPKTSRHHDQVARAIRLAGLARIMQLSMACALPPYSWLSGAWLAALAPFTELGLEAFRKSCAIPDADADLAAIVTTTAMAKSGVPFRGHRVAQLAPKGVIAIPGASGNVYSRADPPAGVAPLCANFEDFVSPAVKAMARDLFAKERAEQYARLNSPDASAMAYALRRVGLDRRLYEGNEMGVHIGALGSQTLDYLRTGQPRPLGARPLLDWDQVVDVWTRRFLPAPANIGESADNLTRGEHRDARQRRLDAARSFPADRIKLSSLFDAADPMDRIRLADIAPPKQKEV